MNWTPPAPTAVPAPPIPPIRDIHSCANVNDIKPLHLHLDWSIDWDAKCIRGAVTHELEVQKDGTAHATFDTSYLDIREVQVDGARAAYQLEARRGPLGEPLRIHLGERMAGDRVKVAIDYATTPKCTALGWLSASQTRAKKTPFLYSQCQAIHGRSLVPCMDTPSRKVTYTARVNSSIPVLMSALRRSSASDVYEFCLLYTSDAADE